MARHEFEGTEAMCPEAHEEIAVIVEVSEEDDLSASIVTITQNKKGSPRISLRKIATREPEEIAMKEEDSDLEELEVGMMEDSEVATDTVKMMAQEIGTTLKTLEELACSELEEVRCSLFR